MDYVQMKVQLVAQTGITPGAHIMDGLLGYDGSSAETNPNAANTLIEFAGRLCYQSWHKPNPETAKNSDYIANLLRQQHYSVLEHASATLYVLDASRSFLAEITRHRHLSFSVVSQRYVEPDSMAYVMPPALEGDDEAEGLLSTAYEEALEIYHHIFTRLSNKGFTTKKAREAARAVMPNMTPVDMVITGNMRSWRDVLAKRSSPTADAEIRAFSKQALIELRKVSPECFSDFPA